MFEHVAGMPVISFIGLTGKFIRDIVPQCRQQQRMPQKDQIGQPRKPRCDIEAIEFRHNQNHNDSDDDLVQNFP